MTIKKLILAGGSGFLGQIIINKFYNTSTQVIVLSRAQNKENKNIRYLQWDGNTIGDWALELDGADVLINLTGKNVDCRYTEENKKEIISSRVNATNVLAQAIAQTKHAPALWINASGAAIYNNADDKSANEFSPEGSTEFMADVSKQWEKAFNESITPSTRKIIMRITLVLGKSGGIWPVLSKLTKLGLGGKMGNGKQYISWIHETDFLNTVLWFIQNNKVTGVYNLAAPHPVTNKAFMKLMRNKYHIPFGMPATAWMLEIGAFFLRTETELILKSRRVVSKKLMDEGFEFQFATIERAMDDLM